MISCTANANFFELSSPNEVGIIKVEVDAGSVFYTYSKHGIPVIQRSRLGLKIDALDLQNLVLSSVKKSIESYQLEPVLSN